MLLSFHSLQFLLQKSEAIIFTLLPKSTFHVQGIKYLSQKHGFLWNVFYFLLPLKTAQNVLDLKENDDNR